MVSAKEKRQAIFKAVDDSIAMQQEATLALVDESHAQASTGMVSMVLLGTLMAAMGAGITWLTARRLRRALGAEPRELGAIAQRVADGDLQRIERGDLAPQGSVLASLSDMQTKLAAIVSQVRHSSESIATGSAQIATGNADPEPAHRKSRPATCSKPRRRWSRSRAPCRATPTPRPRPVSWPVVPLRRPRGAAT